MIKRILITLIIFYLLTLLQTSFFIHFRIWGIVPNFILISVMLINVFEKPQKDTGIFAGFIGGFLLDIFSSNLIGFYAFIFLVSAFLIKIIFRKYVCPVIRLGTLSYDRVGPDFYGKVSKK